MLHPLKETGKYICRGEPQCDFSVGLSPPTATLVSAVWEVTQMDLSDELSRMAVVKAILTTSSKRSHFIDFLIFICSLHLLLTVNYSRQ